MKKFTPPHSNYTGRWDPLCDCGNFEVFFKSSTVPMGIPSVCVKEFLPPHPPRKSKVPRQGGGGGEREENENCNKPNKEAKHND